MTGYGFAQTNTDAFTLSVEIKAYNNRFLELSCSLPPSLSAFELAIFEKVKGVVKRGHIEITVRLRHVKSTIQLSVDVNAVERYTQAFQQIRQNAHKSLKPTISDYVSSEGVLTVLKEADLDPIEKVLWDLVDQATKSLLETKKNEGEALKKDLLLLIKQLQEHVNSVEAYTKTLEQKLKESLHERLNLLLGEVELDQSRLHQEIALLLTKASVREELVRLQAHLKASEQLFDSSEAVGKRLDFLCQEMNREINTIGSKSTMVEVSQHVVAMKDALENIREQVRNIE
ncbi:MAG: YicC/YloC family endoribonuclease [Sphaerochaetaceae bacterium]